MKKVRIDTILFILILTGLGIANLLNFDKPVVSDLENRALKHKPQFSIAEVFNGRYLKSFEEYYSDTFIVRDDLVKANMDLRQAIEFLGPDVELITAYDDIQNASDVGLEYDNSHGANANQLENSISSPDDMSDNPDTSGQAGSLIEGSPTTSSSGAEGQSPEGQSSEGQSPEDPNAQDQYPEEEAIQDFGDGQDVGYWLVVDGKAVQLFKFNKESFEYYAQILNKYNERLGSDVKIYSMIPPTNSEFVQLKRYKGITDSQNEALGFLKSKLDRRITSINVYDALNKHKDEYIFFRTDHHWTALGAYYAYEAFMETIREPAVPLEQYEELDLGDFLGSSYTKTLNKSLEKNPDQVVAYKPFTSNEYLMYDGKTEKKAEVIDLKYTDKITNKYLTFMSTGGGTWSVIKTDVNNGKKIVVIKDSFGNAFVPFLLPHYEEIYVVDARFYSIKATGKNITQFVEDNEIDEVLFLIYMEDVNWHKFMNGVENLLGIEEAFGSKE